MDFSAVWFQDVPNTQFETNQFQFKARFFHIQLLPKVCKITWHEDAPQYLPTLPYCPWSVLFHGMRCQAPGWIDFRSAKDILKGKKQTQLQGLEFF